MNNNQNDPISLGTRTNIQEVGIGSNQVTMLAGLGKENEFYSIPQESIYTVSSIKLRENGYLGPWKI